MHRINPAKLHLSKWTAVQPVNREKHLPNLQVEAEVERYERFWNDFDSEDAAQTKISYLVVYTTAGDPMTNIDRWFDRDSGESLGAYTLYRLTPKTDR